MRRSSIFLLAIAFSLRDLLATPGIISHTWDWDVPELVAQIQQNIARFAFVWDYQFRGGFYSPYRPEGLYWLLTFPLSFLGGENFSKCILVILLFIAATSMCYLCANVLRLNEFWSIFAGILYALSPVAYSRLIAGHMHMLSPYAVFPLLFLFAWRVTNTAPQNRRFILLSALSGGMVWGYEGVHPSFFAMASVGVGLIVILAFMQGQIRWKALWGLALMGIVFFLVSAYWALPVGTGYLTTGTLYHSGWPTQQPDQVKASSVILTREQVNANSIQPISDAIRQNSSSTFDTEFTYPIPESLGRFWLFSSYLVPVLAFGFLLTRGTNHSAGLALAILGLLGVTLVGGSTILAGSVLSQWLLTHLFPLWAEFSNVTRAFPLVALAYSSLVAASLQQISQGNHGWKRFAINTGAVIGLVIYASPFLSGSQLLNARSSYVLKLVQPASEDRALYATLQTNSDNSRVTYVAPPWLGVPEYYDLGYEWFGGLSALPEFFRPFFSPEAWHSASDFRTVLRPGLPGRLLALGAVQYVVYPRGKYFEFANQLFPQSDDRYARGAQTIGDALEAQSNLKPIGVPLTQTIVYHNEAYLPRIYATSSGTLVSGKSNRLADVADSSLWTDRPAFFFDEDQNARALDTLPGAVDRVVLAQPGDKPSILSSIQPDYLFTSTLPSGVAAAFSTAQPTQRVIKVQATPFRLSADGPKDVVSATLAQPLTTAGIQWTGNVPFNDYASTGENSLQVGAYLNGSTRTQEFVEMNQPIAPIRLSEFPIARLASQVDNPQVQAIEIAFNLDFNGDGRVDATWTSPAYSNAKLKSVDMDILESVQKAFPDKPQPSVIGLTIRFEKIPWPDWITPGFPQTLYHYSVQPLEFYQNLNPGAAIRRVDLPDDASSAPTTVLAKSLDRIDVRRFPIALEYQLDGPAMVDASWQLIVQNNQGITQTLNLYSQLITPFSQGNAVLDARELLPLPKVDNASEWRAIRLKVVAEHLIDQPEARPSTIALTRVGSQWLPQSPGEINAPLPRLTIDDNPISLKRDVSSDLDHVLFSSEEITLPAGLHQLFVDGADPTGTLAVQSVQIASEVPKLAATPPRVSFQQINPTRYRVHVEDASSPFFLVFSESYHGDWAAFIENDPARNFEWYEPSALLSASINAGKRTEITKHYQVNGYANSWYVERTGTCDIVIEFTPQRLYELGIVLSASTVIVCLIVIASAQLSRRSKGKRGLIG